MVERMKGITDEVQYSVGLLEGGTALYDVIDNHIDEQTLVRTFLLTQTWIFDARKDLGIIVFSIAHVYFFHPRLRRTHSL